jgi:hypothetical protein
VSASQPEYFLGDHQARVAASGARPPGKYPEDVPSRRGIEYWLKGTASGWENDHPFLPLMTEVFSL